MVNYLNGKIYRIVCNDTGKQYIGSTTSPLTIRLCQHRKLMKDGRSGSSKEVLKKGNYNIILLEDYPCDKKEHLLARERYYIETMECVNKKIPLRTRHEWYEENKDVYIARQMIWNNNNKDKLKEYQETFKAKGKVINLTDDENIHLDIEDIYESTDFLTEDEKYELIENIINNKNI